MCDIQVVFPLVRETAEEEVNYSAVEYYVCIV